MNLLCLNCKLSTWVYEDDQVEDERNIHNVLHFCFPTVMQTSIRVECEDGKKEHLEVKFGMKPSSLETMENLRWRKAMLIRKRGQRNGVWEEVKDGLQVFGRWVRWGCHREYCAKCSLEKSQFGLETLLKIQCYFRPPSSEEAAGNLSLCPWALGISDHPDSGKSDERLKSAGHCWFPCR